MRYHVLGARLTLPKRKMEEHPFEIQKYCKTYKYIGRVGIIEAVDACLFLHQSVAPPHKEHSVVIGKRPLSCKKCITDSLQQGNVITL
jgi:hypothetical protein